MTHLHISRINVPAGYKGHSVSRVIDPEGEFIEVYDRFQMHLIDQGVNYETFRRYSPMPARLIDFFYSVGVAGTDTTNDSIDSAVQDFKSLLEYGCNSPIKRVREYAEATAITSGLSQKSFAPTIAAINLFLHVCQDLGKRVIAHAKIYGIANDVFQDIQLTIKTINSVKSLNEYEKKRLRQNSLYGGVVRAVPNSKFERLQGVKVKRAKKRQSDDESGYFDFPLSRFGDLIEAMPTYRDKAYFLLQGGGGLRGHEAQNLRLAHLDFKNQKIWVEDPYNLRASDNMSFDEKIRFKGRKTSRVYIYEPAASLFFKYIGLYLKHEYVPNCGHDYLFQVLEAKHRSKPLKNARDRGLTTLFRRIVKKLGILGPDPLSPEKLFTPHSLRHLYGVYLLNYIPLGDGKFGYQNIGTVQSLMGHEDPNSTKHYARKDRRLREYQVQVSDEIIMNGGLNLHDLPDMIAGRLISEAHKILNTERSQ